MEEEKNEYLKIIDSKIKKFKLLIYVLSISYGLYDYMKCNYKSNKSKEFNMKLANTTKKLYLTLSIYIFVMIAFYDSKIRGIKSIQDICFIIISIIIPILILYILTDSWNTNICEFTEILNEKNFLKNVYTKNISISLFIGIFVYWFILIIGYKYLNKEVTFMILTFAIYYFGISRPIHFFVVFIRDIIKKISKNESRDGDGKVRLIIIAIGSYINIIIDYSILFYLLNLSSKLYFNSVIMFDNKINNIIDMLYYTSGCETFSPHNFLTRILVIVKSLSVGLLITGNLAIYISLSNNDKLNKKNDYINLK